MPFNVKKHTRLPNYPYNSSINTPTSSQIRKNTHRLLLVLHISSSFSLCFRFLRFLCFSGVFRQELANSQLKDLEETEHKNQKVVLALYEALKSRDVKTVHQILAPDLEWWFHGPPTHQFMMRLLTGSKSSPSSSSSTDTSFEFAPYHITSFGPTVIAEGYGQSGQISWVHAWTVTDGIITQVREYFNTSLTVTRIGPPSSSSSDCSPRSSTSSTLEINSVHCPSVWESSFSSRVGKSVPGLVLAI